MVIGKKDQRKKMFLIFKYINLLRKLKKYLYTFTRLACTHIEIV